MSGKFSRLRTISSAAALLFTLWLSGCVRTVAPGPAPVYRIVPSSAVKSVDWYFDATASLQGFVSPRATGPSYVQFVKTMEVSLDNLHLQPAALHTYKFGTASRPFTDVKDTFRPDFYSAAEGFRDTDLEVVGKALNPDGMTIIITDLFQSDNHIESFRKALLNKGLGTRFQFGVLALQAGFQGTLYDIPPLGTSMPYQGLHPVYAILLGPQQQVRALMNDVLRRGTSEISSGVVQGAMLSSQLATPVVPLHELRERESDANHVVLTEINTAASSEGSIIDESNGVPSFAMALDLPHVATHPQFQYQTELRFEPFAVLPAHSTSPDGWRLDSRVHVCGPGASNTLESIVHGFAHKRVEVAQTVDGDMAGSPSTRSVSQGNKTDPCPVSNAELLTIPPTVQIAPVPHGVQAAITVDLGNSKDRVNPFKARPKSTYVVELKLLPNEQDYVFPAWVQEFTQQPGSKFSGLRTPNLLDFLTNMNQSIAQAESPAALDDYLYIQSN